MKNILAVCLAVLLLTIFGASAVFAGEEVSPDALITEEEKEEEEILLKVPDIEGFVVKKLPFGVTLILEPDQPIRRPWSKSFTFDIDHDLKEKSSYATTGFWFGNGITSYWITYSRNVHTEDAGRTSFSFTYAF